MALALSLTGLTAMFVVQQPQLLQLIFANRFVFYGLLTCRSRFGDVFVGLLNGDVFCKSRHSFCALFHLEWRDLILRVLCLYNRKHRRNLAYGRHVWRFSLIGYIY